MPELLGGSADLTGSNLTDFPGCGAVRGGQAGGNHINYGVREFGMAAIMNGMALHGGFIPYGGTFLTFSDYSRNAMRMAALMKLRVIHVFTHDSIGLGEDGPTHQPVEHAAEPAPDPEPGRLAPLRCGRDGGGLARTRSSTRDGPSALLLSRQTLPAAGAHAGTGRRHRARRLRAERPRGRRRRCCSPPARKSRMAMAAQQLLDARGVAGARGLDAQHAPCSTASRAHGARPCSAAGCRASASRPA